MYQDLIQELRIQSPKFTDHNARKRNMHSEDEIDIMEPMLPMLTVTKASTRFSSLKLSDTYFPLNILKNKFTLNSC